MEQHDDKNDTQARPQSDVGTNEQTPESSTGSTPPQPSNGGTAPPPPAQGVSLEEALEEVNQLLQEQEEALNDAMGNLKDATNAQKAAEAKRKALDDIKKTLEQLVSQLQSSATNLEQQRQSARAVQEAAETYYTELMHDLEASLSDAYRDHIDEAIATVDEQIENLEEQVEEQKQAVKAAEDKLAQARRDATEADAAFRNAQAELQQLATRIQSAVSEVNRLRKAAETADKNGPSGETYFLARELESAIETLEEAIAPETEEDVRDAIAESWQAATNARLQVTAATEELNRAKAALTQTESDLQTAIRQRTATIQQKVRDFPENDKLVAAPAATA